MYSYQNTDILHLFAKRYTEQFKWGPDFKYRLEYMGIEIDEYQIKHYLVYPC